MIIRDITVKELPAFIESRLYRDSRIVPITPERAISQVNNPRAQPDDVVLVVAYTEEGQLAGFAGMLPDTGNSTEGSYRFAWNSGWWIDTERGRGIALNLLYRSIRAWNGQYMITDLTPHTRKIIALTHLFYFKEPVRSVRLQILSDFAGKFRRKYKSLSIFSGWIALIDRLINAILRCRLSRWKRKNETDACTIEYPKDLENDSLGFIEKYSRGELCRRGRPEFGWIISCPWLVDEASGMQQVLYPFSRECGHFESRWAKIVHRGEIAGIVLLTNRDGLFKIPYAYYDAGQISLFSRAVCRMLIDGGATGFHTFRREITEAIAANAFPVFYATHAVQELAVSRTVSHRHPEKFFLQDGDGDAVFT